MNLFCKYRSLNRLRKASRFLFCSAVAVGFAILAADTLAGAEFPPPRVAMLSEAAKPDPLLYYWKTAPAGETAEFVTLFCRFCGPEPQADADGNSRDIPLLSVLRDTLGDSDPRNDRLLYVWLLTYVRPNKTQYILSAMPFLYWRVGDGPSHAPRTVSPLLNLTTPERSLVFDISRQVLQLSVFNPSATPVRATSRTYQNNELNYQRLRLEETASYLRKAPVPDRDNGLSQTELHTVLARLELRKRLLGGLVTGKDVASTGAEVGYAQERIRSRNWEVLRQCAERTGLIFEPLKLAGSSARYGILWFSPDAAAPSGISLKPTWKLLNIRNPWNDRHLKTWRGPAYTRGFDGNGFLLSAGSSGVSQKRLIPLAAYSLDYPTAPLLLVDFRDSQHVRRHEMTQRAINDVTAGVIGISHFSNWYYYAAADIYNFVVSRHGAATNENVRLDCYSQFRAALVLDRELDPGLRVQLQRRIDLLALNPLEATPNKSLQFAQAHYEALMAEAQNGKLAARLDKERRGELAEFGESNSARYARIVLHDGTLGAYNHRVKKEDGNLAALDRERRVLYHLNFLDSLVDAGTAPEVAYTSDRIQSSIVDLSQLMPPVQSQAVRAHAVDTLKQLQEISRSSDVQGDCATALALLEDAPEQPVVVTAKKGRRPSTGVVALISAHSESAR